MSTMEQWLDSMRGVIRKDWDNVVLVSGKEGTGKSTLVLQLAKVLDPDFDMDRLWFHKDDFLACAKTVPRGSSVVWDEMLMSARRSMSKTNNEVMEFLQVCRGLNLHLFLCTPHEELVDRALTDYRIRWNVRVVRRGSFQVRKRIKKENMGKVWYEWTTVAQFHYKPVKGPLVDAYKEKKEAHMRGHDGLLDEPDYAAARFDPVAAESYLKAEGLL